MTTTNPNGPGHLVLENVRLSFPELFKPTAFKPGDDLKYKATFLIPKGSPQAKAVEAAILAVMKEKHGAKAQKVLDSIRNNPNKCCWQDGDTKDYDGYEGMMALSAKSKIRPTTLARDNSPVTEADGVIYAGCYVKAIVDLFNYDSSGAGISAGLSGVRFSKDGDAFGGGRAAAPDEFGEPEGEDAEDFA